MPLLITTGRRCSQIERHASSTRRRVPARPHRREVGQPQVRHEARQPGEQAPKFKIIIVGSGLAGASAAASLGELGYHVQLLTFHDSPRRAHSIAAQGGINAAKNYRNDGDSVHRLFYDTVKGGDYRAREANVYRLAQLSVEHHRPVRRAGRAVRTRVRRPARQPQLRRRAGLPHVLRTRARPGSSCCSARTQALRARCTLGNVELFTRIGDARARASRTAAPSASSPATSSTATVQSFSGHAVVLATGGYGNVFFLSTNAKDSNAIGDLAGAPQGRAVRQPLLHADPPDVHPGERRLPVEAHA